MFSFMTKALELVWPSNGTSGPEASNPSQPEETNFTPCESATEKDLVTLVPKVKKELVGKVTDLSDGYGLVNNYIYFSFDVILGGSQPVVGQSVLVTAVGSDKGGWTAERVMETEDWESEIDGEVHAKKSSSSTYKKVHSEPVNNVADQHLTSSTLQESSTIIGMISDLSGSTLMLNGNLLMMLLPGACEFPLMKGDWVTATLGVPDEQEEISCIINAQPLRKQHFQAPITFINQNFGVVDDEVFFSRDLLRNGYFPKKDDIVSAVAIESNQMRYGWRAITIVPMSSTISHHQHQGPAVASGTKNRFLKELLGNKEGVIVTPILDFGQMELNRHKELLMKIKNTSSEVRILQSVKIQTKAVSQFTCSILDGTPSEKLNPNWILNPNDVIEIKILCVGRNIGITSQLMILTFEGRFEIGRQLTANVIESQKVLNGRPFHWQNALPPPKMVDVDNGVCHLIPGARPIIKSHFRLPIQLPEFRVPKNLRTWLDEDRELLHSLPCLAEALNDKNYSIKLHNLLYLEEIQAEKEISKQNLREVLFQHHRDFLLLEIPGMSDDRPSVFIGDKVIATFSLQTANAPHYEGFVHEVTENKIWLKFHPSFHEDYKESDLVDIDFQLNRMPLRRAHQAVELARNLCPTMLFPKSIQTKTPNIIAFEKLSTCSHCKKPETKMKDSTFQEDEQNGVTTPETKELDASNLVPNEENFQVDHEKTNVSMRPMTEDTVSTKMCASEMKTPTVLDTQLSPIVQQENSSSGRKRRQSVVERLFSAKTPEVDEQSTNLDEKNELKRTTSCTKPESNQVRFLGNQKANKVEIEQTPDQSPLLPKHPEIPIKNVVTGLPPSGPFASQGRLISKLKARGIFLPNTKSDTVAACKCKCHDVNAKTTLDEEKRQICWVSILNERQKAAVRNILAGIARPMPYIIYGPPGTGKTTTVVEAILQILRICPSSRILLCAPSNSAADLLTECIHRSGQVDASKIVRLNAFQRVTSTISNEILPYCQVADNLKVLSRRRLIICTCVTAGSLYSLGLHQGHFSHIFVDEAGQATEPECLIPLLFAGHNGQVILAGDPQQLGPVVQSQFAIQYGLQMSFLERIMERSLYVRNEEHFAGHGCYDPMIITKLINSYRMHPALILLPSTLFYNSELKSCGDKELTHRFCNWKHLPKKDFPLLFHGVQGENLREGNNPSWFNPSEVMQVIHYLQRLYENCIDPSEIGVITPYRKQVEKLKMMMKSLDIAQPKIGSVEEFQGQERPVIILTTVRSVEGDSHLEKSLGFLRNFRRFNVSITRSRALLLVIGNPHVLAKDRHWESLLRYCISEDVYIGCNFNFDE